MSKTSGRVVLWWVLALVGVLVALLVVWATRVLRVAPVTLLTAFVVVIALSWLVVLVRMPWNLYFAARRAAQEMAVSRERGISVRPADDAETRRISRWMLRLAIGGHLVTAAAAAVIAYVSGSKTGYYIAGVFLLSTAFRPGTAYLLHVRERIKVLTRESTHPRDDVVALRGELTGIKRSVEDLQAGMRNAGEDLVRMEARLTDASSHNRNLLSTDLSALKAAQEADRALARSRDDDLEHRLSQLARRIEDTLDGISDQADLAVGLRALVRMIRSEPA